MENKGLLIVFEGIDGAGCETQSKLFLSHIKHRYGSKSAIYFDYPDYKSVYGKLLNQFLNRKLKISRKEAFFLYFLDQLKDVEKVKKALDQKKFVIMNRYFTSNIAYNSDIISPKHAVALAENFGLPKPNFVFYLDISPKESIRRKSLEKKGKWDINESKIDKLTNVRKAYFSLALEHKWCHNWILIDGQRAKKVIAEDIWNKFLKSL
ncbi:MAG: dTMP kinase [Candidatus Nanoarchaeia archaeon]